MTGLKLRGVLALTILFATAPVLAQDYGYGYGTASNDQSATSTAQASAITNGYLNAERFAFTPELGTITYGTPNNGTQTRGIIGLGIDMNAVTAFIPPSDRNATWSNVYIGPQTGFFFAHTGSASSNFWGTSATTADAYVGANLMYIPLDLTVGWNFTDNFRVSVHGGGNITYQSITGTVNIGNATTFASTSSTSSSWNIFPNVGGDVEFGVGHNISVLLRPDVTLATGTSPFTGTVGLGIALS